MKKKSYREDYFDTLLLLDKGYKKGYNGSNLLDNTKAQHSTYDFGTGIKKLPLYTSREAKLDKLPNGKYKIYNEGKAGTKEVESLNAYFRERTRVPLVLHCIKKGK